MKKKISKKSFVQEVETVGEQIEMEWKKILFNFLIMFFSMLVILYLKKELLVSVFLFLIAIIGILKWRSKLNIVIFLFFGFVFGLAEIVISGYGALQYRVSQIGVVPAWLFILWGITAMFIFQMTLEIKKIWSKL